MNILYVLFAILNLIIPIYFLIRLTKEIGIFAFNEYSYKLEFKTILILLITYIVVLSASWATSLLLGERQKEINKLHKNNNEFVASPIIAHIIKTLGEWVGTWIAILGFFVPLIFEFGIMPRSFIYQLSDLLSFFYLGGGFVSILLAPVVGYFVILITRFVAEQLKVLTSIANNTKKHDI